LNNKNFTITMSLQLTENKGEPFQKMVKADELSAASALLTLDTPLLVGSESPIPTTDEDNYINRPSSRTKSTLNYSKSMSIDQRTLQMRKRKHLATTLFDIIEDKQNEDIIHWVLDGRAFIISDKKRFELEILPRYFKRTQFPSFTRKLIRWGFNRVARGKLLGAYYHKYFQKASPNLCKLMTCGDHHSDCHQSKHERTSAHNSNSPSSHILIEDDEVHKKERKFTRQTLNGSPSSKFSQDDRAMPAQGHVPKRVTFKVPPTSNNDDDDATEFNTHELNILKKSLSQELYSLRVQQIQRMIKIRELELRRSIQAQKRLNQKRAALLLYARERQISRRKASMKALRLRNGHTAQNNHNSSVLKQDDYLLQKMLASKHLLLSLVE